MTTMVTEVYDAFVSAGAPDDKARRAAEVLVNYDKEFAGIQAELKVLTEKVGVLQLVAGVNLAASLAILGLIAALFRLGGH